MDDFPSFMKKPENEISASSQSKGIEGWVYDSEAENQMAYWKSKEDVVSEEHVHEFDEYFIVVQGQYILIIANKEICIHAGDEYFIPKRVPHAIRAGYRNHSSNGKGSNKLCKIHNRDWNEG